MKEKCVGFGKEVDIYCDILDFYLVGLWVWIVVLRFGGFFVLWFLVKYLIVLVVGSLVFVYGGLLFVYVEYGFECIN